MSYATTYLKATNWLIYGIIVVGGFSTMFTVLFFIRELWTHGLEINAFSSANQLVTLILIIIALVFWAGFVIISQTYSKSIKSLNQELTDYQNQIKLIQTYLTNFNQEKTLSIPKELSQLPVFKALNEIHLQTLQVINNNKRIEWKNNGSYKLTELLRQHLKIETLIEDYITTLARIVDAGQGMIIVPKQQSIKSDKVAGNDYWLAGFACINLERFLVHNYCEDGLLHQIMLDKQTKLVSNAPVKLLEVASGLGVSDATNVLFVPLVFENVAYGLLEVSRFSGWQPHEINFIEEQASKLAATLFNLKATFDTQQMLAEAQKLTEALKQRESELLDTNQKILNTQKALEQSQTQIQRIMANVPDVIFQMRHSREAGFGFVFVSDRIEQVVGLTKEKLLTNFNALTIHADDVQSWHQALNESAKNVSQLVWQGRMQHALTQKELWININAIADKQGTNHTVWDGILADVTERVMYQQQVSQLNENLEIKVRERTQALETALEELKETQMRMVQSEKLASMGQLVAGVAHEMNTPLAAIKAAVENMQDFLPIAINDLPVIMECLSENERHLFQEMVTTCMSADDQLSTRDERHYRKSVEELLDEHEVLNSRELAKKLVVSGIRQNVEHFLPLIKHQAASLIIQTAYHLAQMKNNLQVVENAVNKTRKTVYALKRYSHFQQEQTFEHLDLKDSIEVILTIYHNQLKHGVKVIKEFEDVPPVLGLTDELGQVWTNIITNAAQAMKYEGELKIRLYQAGEFAVVTITDNGPGIPEHVMPRIFEPFFTTKPQGEGTGLGLDICKKIIDKHNGFIEVSSKPGETCFTIKIPIQH